MTPPDVRTPPARGANAQDQGTQSTGIVSDLDASRKSFVTMQATAANAGCALYELSSGKFLLTRWGLARELPDLRAVAAMLQQMNGGRHA